MFGNGAGTGTIVTPAARRLILPVYLSVPAALSEAEAGLMRGGSYVPHTGFSMPRLSGATVLVSV